MPEQLRATTEEKRVLYFEKVEERLLIYREKLRVKMARGLSRMPKSPSKIDAIDAHSMLWSKEGAGGHPTAASRSCAA